MLNETPTTLCWVLDFLRCFGRVATPPNHILTFGEVLEWLKRHAWKACKRQKRFGGSNPPLSAGRFQKGFTKEVNLAFKIQIIVVKSRFYNDFSLYIALSFDGITLCSRPLKSFDK